MLRYVGLLGMTLALFCSRAQGADLPNIVFVLADDLGWNDVQIHGGKWPTPTLKQLRQDGVELTQHYVAPVCSPTRASLLSGRYWSRFGVTTPTNERVFGDEVVTLPKALQACGYDTCLIGKWHLGSRPEWGPNRFGFKYAYGSLAGGVGPYRHAYKESPFSQTWHRNGEFIEEEGHVTDLLTAEATRYIATQAHEPFFLYVPLTAVHLPIQEPEEWLKRAQYYGSTEMERQYCASVMHMDDAVGRIRAALD
ncbi:MAG: sulfatase-like hydrolase/transferase, partial [Planctomycetales bacterium]|nr:sulfatase-like hydrolase/transferase [Planctomycetales bacterium]